ncbi:MAG: hypothetical protein JKY53_00770 [Flavobacteriales bacterium]|nr:hypothetical protein [Flavobacteriales bacterium]
MRRTLIILSFILIAINSIGQDIASSFMQFNLTLPSQSSLLSNNISRIEAIDYYPNDTSELNEIWLIDTSGLVIKHELLEIEDTTPSFTIYKYEHQRKASMMRVGIWNTKGIIDTVHTTYNYNNKGELQKIIVTGKFTYETKRYYQDDNLIYEIITDTINDRGFVVIDTIFYTKNSQPVRRVSSNDNAIWLWGYDKNGQLLEKVLISSNDSNLVFQKYVMTYKSGKLIYEEKYYSMDGSKEKQSKSAKRYYYNTNDLIVRVEKLDGKNFVLNGEYKYYKE